MPKIVFRKKNEAERLYPVKHYILIKDNYCIAYFGNFREYLVQLIALRPIIESQFPGIKIYLASNPEMFPALMHLPRTLHREEIGNAKEKFAYLREIKCDLQNHPVLELVEESNIEIPKDYFKIPDIANKCVIITKGVDPPTKPLTQDQIKKCIELAESRNFPWELDGNCDGAGWVIGVESYQLYLAGVNGAKTTLVPTGIGTNLYKKMFSDGEIMT